MIAFPLLSLIFLSRNPIIQILDLLTGSSNFLRFSLYILSVFLLYFLSGFLTLSLYSAFYLYHYFLGHFCSLNHILISYFINTISLTFQKFLMIISWGYLFLILSLLRPSFCLFCSSDICWSSIFNYLLSQIWDIKTWVATLTETC